MGYESLLRESLGSTDRVLEVAIDEVRASEPNQAELQTAAEPVARLRDSGRRRAQGGRRHP